MACFGYFKRKPRAHSAPVASSSSAPASSSTSTNQSDGWASGRPISKSAGSVVSQRSIPDMYEERAHNLRVFEMDELRAAIHNFNKMLKLGEGGFGSVYKGFIKTLDGKGSQFPVAVKKLNLNGMQAHILWSSEVQFLGALEHPNLVKIIGYCAIDGERGNQRLLVYEFMPNKSLEDHLFNRAYPALSWNLRLQIALGAAQELAYLHEFQVIYRDFKTSNVLLDKEFRPKLSDFGLAREGPQAGRSHVTTAVVGTYGYAAPEYVETGHLTVKSDVWAFGIVLYEILTGRRSLERNLPVNQQKLLEWVRQFPVESRKFSMIMDPRLRNEYSLEAAREIGRLANSCLLKNAKERPSMIEIVEGLNRAIQIETSEELASTTNANKKRPDPAPKRSTRR